MRYGSGYVDQIPAVKGVVLSESAAFKASVKSHVYIGNVHISNVMRLIKLHIKLEELNPDDLKSLVTFGGP